MLLSKRRLSKMLTASTYSATIPSTARTPTSQIDRLALRTQKIAFKKWIEKESKYPHLIIYFVSALIEQWNRRQWQPNAIAAVLTQIFSACTSPFTFHLHTQTHTHALLLAFSSLLLISSSFFLSFFLIQFPRTRSKLYRVSSSFYFYWALSYRKDTTSKKSYQ